MPSLVGLPIDLHLVVLRYLHPKDIASTRQTCKTMEKVTKTRAVWLDALKRICLSYGVPFVTYDFERMSCEQLEYAATAPDRFMHLGRSAMNSPSRVLHPIEERRLPLPPSRRVPFANDELRWEDLVLLPGGRFVLGYTDALLVWDLTSKSDDPFVVIDENNDFGPGLRMCYVHLGSLGYYPTASKIRLVVSATCKSENHGTTAPAIACVACELDLAESPPALRVLGALHDAAFVSFAGSGSRIAFYSRTNTWIVGVWDFNLDAAASWESKGLYEADPFVVTEKHIVCQDQGRGSMVLYALPPLVANDGRVPVPSDLRAIQALALPHANTRWSVSTKPSNYDASSVGDVLAFDNSFIPLGELEPPYPDNYDPSVRGGLLSITRFFVRLKVEQGYAVLTMQEGPVLQEYIAHLAPPKQCDDKITVVYRPERRGYGQTLRVHSSSLDDPTNAQTICIGPREGSLFPSSEEFGPRTDFDFCPMTGRLCIARSQDLNAIVVYDTIPSYVAVKQE